MARIQIEAPTELTLAEKNEFIKVVKAAGEAPGISMARVDEAECLVRYFSPDEIIGTAALKKPLDVYRKSCFSKAGHAELERFFPLELGYVWAHDSARGRGLGHLLAAAALSWREKKTGVFATSESTNLGMHRVLESRHFERAGKDWSAPRDGKPNRRLALFLSPGVESAP
jgi:GNAT superfamily N-acetyltransferase